MRATWQGRSSVPRRNLQRRIPSAQLPCRGPRPQTPTTPRSHRATAKAAPAHRWFRAQQVRRAASIGPMSSKLQGPDHHSVMRERTRSELAAIRPKLQRHTSLQPGKRRPLPHRGHHAHKRLRTAHDCPASLWIVLADISSRKLLTNSRPCFESIVQISCCDGTLTIIATNAARKLLERHSLGRNTSVLLDVVRFLRCSGCRDDTPF